jgi:hypothetical protein
MFKKKLLQNFRHLMWWSQVRNRIWSKFSGSSNKVRIRQDTDTQHWRSTFLNSIIPIYQPPLCLRILSVQILSSYSIYTF